MEKLIDVWIVMLKVTDTEVRRPLNIELLLNIVWKFITYITRNTPRLRYKDQPADAV
jgi:hypothetical protein